MSIDLKIRAMKKLINVLNEKVAPWIRLKMGLHVPALKPIQIVPNTTTKK
jgi:hypothetical protein